MGNQTRFFFLSRFLAVKYSYLFDQNTVIRWPPSRLLEAALMLQPSFVEGARRATHIKGLLVAFHPEKIDRPHSYRTEGSVLAKCLMIKK